MDEQAGRVFSIGAENAPVPGCTVSRTVWQTPAASLAYFSLAEDTDISAELYGYPKLQMAVTGKVQATGAVSALLGPGGAVVTPTGVPIGMCADENAVFIELSLEKETVMNPIIEAGRAFSLKDLAPYQDGRIVNMDVASSSAYKLVAMSFDAGTALAEHAAPGEALVFALDGEATIAYEGEEHLLRAGEAFKFDAGGRHAVRADKRFKMALFLTLA